MGFRRRILVVDTDGEQLRSIGHCLETEGFEVATARTADEALDTLELQDFDGALVELRLPGTHGLNLTRSLRRLQPDLVVLLTSAFELSARQLERCDCGAAGFVAKPCAAEAVVRALRAKLERTVGPGSRVLSCGSGAVESVALA